MTHLHLPEMDSAFVLGMALKATLLVACAGAASVAMARLRASAATRHLVWTLAVAALLALPLVSTLLPGWRVGIIPSLTDQALTAAVDASVDVSALPAEMQAATASRTSPAAVDAAAPTVASKWTDALREIGWGRAAVLAYLAGMLLLLARMAAGQWGVRRLARRAEPVADPAWTGLLRDLSWMLGVRRPVRLLRSPRATMPMTWGVRRPVVLIPAEADAWPEERRRVVLLHELAHVARHDCLTQALAEAVRALYWPHPGAWYAARRLRVERELACDDRVLAAGTRPKTYAAHLLEVARAFRAPPLAAAAAVSMARPSQLEGRLLAVLDTVRSRRTPGRRASLAAGVAAAALVLPLALLHPGGAAEASTSSWDGASAQDSVFERRLPARSGGSLEIVVETGAAVRVEGWDRDELHVRAVQSGPDRNRLRVSVQGDGREFEVASRLDGGRSEADVRQEMVVHVPRRFDVSVRSSGGTVQVAGVTGSLRGSTDGGRLVLVNASGTAHFSTDGGHVEVRDSRLDGRIEPGGGRVAMARSRGHLDVGGAEAIATTVAVGGAGVAETVVVPATASGEGAAAVATPVVAGGAVTVTPCRGGECEMVSEVLTTTAATARAGRAVSVAPCRGGECVAVTASGASAVATPVAAGRTVTVTPCRGGECEMVSEVLTTTVPTARAGRAVSVAPCRGGECVAVAGSGASAVATPVAAGRAVTVTPCRGGECEPVASEVVTTTVPPARAGRAASAAPCRGDGCVAVATGGVAVTAARAEGVTTMTTTTPTTAAGRGKPRTAQAESADGTAEGLYRIVMSAREEETRTQVLAVLADVPGEVALGRLVAVSRRHPDADTRRMAVEVLGRRRSGEALRALEWSAFNDPSGQVQRAAVGAIAAAVDGPASLAEVRPLLERVERTHPSAPVRAHAREIMGELAERFGRR